MIHYTPHYNVEDYQSWQGDWELLNGVAVSMTPSPFGQHQFVAANLLSELRSAIKSANGSAYVLSEIDWIVDASTVVRPDIVVVDQVPERHVENPPQLVVEVLSESTAEKDRTFKLELYQQNKIPTYVIIDPESKRIELFELAGEKYAKQAVAETLNLNVANIAIAIPLDGIFD